MPDHNAAESKVAEVISKLYFTSAGVPGTEGTQGISEEHAIRLASKFVVSVLTAWWSLTEFFDYLKKRQEFREFERLTSSVNSSEKD